MGLATIVSAAPFPVSARLINREPGFIDIKPALKQVQFLVVKDGISRFYVPEEFTPVDKKSHIFIPTMGESIAEEVVDSNVRSTPNVEVGMSAEDGGCQPAIFWVPGAMIKISTSDLMNTLVWHSNDLNVAEGLANLQAKHPGLLEEYKARQNNWYDRLIKDADDKWQKYKMNVVISDIERFAARSMGIKREWVVKLEAANLTNCPFCVTLISPMAMICPNCREIVDQERYDERKAVKKPNAPSLTAATGKV